MDAEHLIQLGRRRDRGPAGGARASASATDPESTSLSALFQSLPTEIQNLLRRVFPSADRIMAEETQKPLAGLKA